MTYNALGCDHTTHIVFRRNVVIFISQSDAVGVNTQMKFGPKVSYILDFSELFSKLQSAMCFLCVIAFAILCCVLCFFVIASPSHKVIHKLYFVYFYSNPLKAITHVTEYDEGTISSVEWASANGKQLVRSFYQLATEYILIKYRVTSFRVSYFRLSSAKFTTTTKKHN